MKQLFSLILLVSVFAFSNAQNFEYSIQYIGLNSNTNNHQIALYLTPDFTQNNVLMNDSFITFSVPSGVTLGNFTQAIEPAAFPNPIKANQYTIDYANTGEIDSNTDRIFLTRDPSLEGGEVSFNLVKGTAIELVRFDIQLNSKPTKGFIKILTNGDTGYDNNTYPNYANFNFVDYIDNNTIKNLSNSLKNKINFTEINHLSEELNTVSFFPNPVKNILNIQGLETELNEVSIYTIGGKKVLTQTTNLEKINTSALAQGVYFVTLKSNNTEKTLKIIKN